MHVHRLYPLNPLPVLRSISSRLYEQSRLRIAIRWPGLLWSWLWRTRRHCHVASDCQCPAKDLISAEKCRGIKRAGKTSHSGYSWRDSFANWDVLVCVHYIPCCAVDRANTGGYSVWMGCGPWYFPPCRWDWLTGEVFSSVFSYLVDAYREWSASAMAANTFLRCIMASGFPLFAAPVSHIEGLGFFNG